MGLVAPNWLPPIGSRLGCPHPPPPATLARTSECGAQPAAQFQTAAARAVAPKPGDGLMAGPTAVATRGGGARGPPERWPFSPQPPRYLSWVWEVRRDVERAVLGNRGQGGLLLCWVHSLRQTVHCEAQYRPITRPRYLEESCPTQRIELGFPPSRTPNASWLVSCTSRGRSQPAEGCHCCSADGHCSRRARCGSAPGGHGSAATAAQPGSRLPFSLHDLKQHLLRNQAPSTAL